MNNNRVTAEQSRAEQDFYYAQREAAMSVQHVVPRPRKQVMDVRAKSLSPEKLKRLFAATIVLGAVVGVIPLLLQNLDLMNLSLAGFVSSVTGMLASAGDALGFYSSDQGRGR